MNQRLTFASLDQKKKKSVTWTLKRSFPAIFTTFKITGNTSVGFLRLKMALLSQGALTVFV